MKLYFYFLDEPYGGKPKVRLEECEVIEKPKTYCMTTISPDGYYRRSVNKVDIGIVKTLYPSISYVSDKREDDAAKEKFTLHLQEQIDMLKKTIAIYEEDLSAVNGEWEIKCGDSTN